jgi:hypothetical protein
MRLFKQGQEIFLGFFSIADWAKPALTGFPFGGSSGAIRRYSREKTASGTPSRTTDWSGNHFPEFSTAQKC